MPAKRAIAYWTKERNHARFVVNCYTHGHCARTTQDARAHAWRRAVLRNHRWLLALAEKKLEELPPPAPVVGHYAGWACITNGATPGAAHEGNGYNGAYSGPLGMTTPWMGHYPPGPDWVHSSPTAVYAIAEEESAARGWSDAWMRGQWPATYPPCAGYFN